MRLRSALDDLTATTLQAVSGLWNSLEYLAGLHSKDGYSHWGLARLHGEKAAQEALATAHKSLLSKVLRSPLKELSEDATRSGEAQGLSGEAYLDKLNAGREELLPQNPPAAAGRHLSSVLYALLALRKSRRGATPRDASPSPPPGQ
jgi:hypothetical protein